MGTALSVFKGSQALQVPRDRFAPVKKCGDLLGLWSDAFSLTKSYQLVNNPERKKGPVVVLLDEKYYGIIDNMQERFPHGAPSLIACDTLKVEGNITFGKDIVATDSVVVAGGSKPVTLKEGTHLSGKIML